MQSVGCRRVLGADGGDAYRGCEGDCVYCFARRGHEFLGRSPVLEFGSVYVKRGAAAVLAREVARRPEGTAVRLGAASDPWMPREEEAGATRECLEALAAGPPVVLHAETKFDLVLRDVDVLLRIAKRGAVRIGVSIATLDGRLAREIEPGAPSPLRRLKIVRRLAAAGLPAGIEAAPVLPALTDRLEDLAALADAAARAGAAWFRGRPLALPAGGPRESFLRWLRRRRPDLVSRYLAGYRGRETPSPGYGERLEAIFATLRTERALAAAPPQAPSPAAASAPGQLSLPFLRAAGTPLVRMAAGTAVR